jgi:hypothetical protein
VFGVIVFSLTVMTCQALKHWYACDEDYELACCLRDDRLLAGPLEKLGALCSAAAAGGWSSQWLCESACWGVRTCCMLSCPQGKEAIKAPFYLLLMGGSHNPASPSPATGLQRLADAAGRSMKGGGS